MNNKYTPKEKILLSQLMIGGFVVGLLLSIDVGYIIFSMNMAVPEGVNKFLFIHQKYPSIFIAWIFPFMLGFTARYFAFVFIKRKKYYDKIIDKKNNTITNNALFAKSIGEGDFDNSNIGELDQEDLLTRSLLRMRDNLIKNKTAEQRNIWINQGKEIISTELRNDTDLKNLAYGVLEHLLDYCSLNQGRFFIYNDEEQKYELTAAYAYNRIKYIQQEFTDGKGLIGQATYERLSIYRNDIPEDYVTITSGILADKKPGSLFIMPLISEDKVQGVIEVANIDNDIPSEVRDLIEALGPIIGQVLFSVNVNLKTKRLLDESRILTEELRENEEELHQNAEEMRMTHEELEKSNDELERQIQEVESAKTRLHSLLENASEIITIFDVNGKIKYESPSTEKILGYNPADIIGMSATDRIAKEYIPLAKKHIEDLHKNPFKTVNYSYVHLRADGTEVWVETTGRNMLDNPAIEGLIFNTRDITLQRIAEKDKRLKSRMQALSENSPDMIIRFGRTGKFHYFNPKALELLGVNTKELTDSSLDKVKLPRYLIDFFNERIENTKKTLKKAEIEFEMEFDDNKMILKVSTIPEYNDEKELETILLVAHDLTEIKAIEREITDKNLKLTESINYAQRIQTAILPRVDILDQHFNSSFMFYKARDVVSGDFPWFKQNENGVYLAAVDCTGHGVPGALLSFIGYFLLNDIINTHPNSKSQEILEVFDAEVRSTLKQDQGGKNTRDGMDIAFCQFSLDMKKLYFSGAHRPLYLMRGDELLHFKGDRRAIGGITPKRKKKEFTLHEIDLQKGDRVFIFSDGLPDQFKAGTYEKFQEKRVRELLSNNMNSSMAEIHEDFETTLAEWQGDYRQIDDIILIGIEI